LSTSNSIRKREHSHQFQYDNHRSQSGQSREPSRYGYRDEGRAVAGIPSTASPTYGGSMPRTRWIGWPSAGGGVGQSGLGADDDRGVTLPVPKDPWGNRSASSWPQHADNTLELIVGSGHCLDARSRVEARNGGRSGRRCVHVLAGEFGDTVAGDHGHFDPRVRTASAGWRWRRCRVRHGELSLSVEPIDAQTRMARDDREATMRRISRMPPRALCPR